MYLKLMRLAIEAISVPSPPILVPMIKMCSYRKTRQQNRSWHIAHDLACQNCSDCLTSGHNTAEEMAELRNTSKVSNKINNAVKWDQIATPFSLNNAHPHQ